MVGLQGICQPLSGNMGIDLRRCYVRVPQQLLHRSKVCPSLKHMRGKSMAQRMGAYLVPIKPNLRRQVFDHLEKALAGKPAR